MNYNIVSRSIKNFLVKILWVLGFIIHQSVWADPSVNLINIELDNSMQDNVKIVLHFSDLPRIPKAFSMDKPAELIFDFENTINKLPKSKMIQNLSLDLIKNITFVNSEDKVRMVIAVKYLLPYTTEINNNDLILTIKNAEANILQEQEKSEYIISALDFNRGEQGEGRLVLDVNSSYNKVDLKDNDNGEIFIEFKKATIPENLLRNFDVGDFGTPIKNIKITKKEDNILVAIVASGEYEKITYHTGNKYVVEARPKTLLEQQLNKSRKFKFTGEKISLNFQDIEIRAVLQLLADFTGMNIIANDSVSGNVTLRLDNIPWDQALDFILKSKGLAKRESGNVVLIAPTEELSKYEEMELSSIKQLEALAPLKTEFIMVNYAKADDMIKLIQGSEKRSMLSSRGSITVDSRTNTLLLKDIEDKVNDIKDLIQNLDVPIKQVLIEAYIVHATQDFKDNLGISLNAASALKIGSRRLGMVGGGANQRGLDAFNIANNGITAATPMGNIFNFTGGGDTKLGLALSRLPGGTLLNLELDLGETESINTVIAKPKVLTLDKQSASIESGADIPYATSSNNNGTNTTFQKAVIKLQVTPQITPNNQISLDLTINNDSPGESPAGGGAAPIKTASLKTNVLVDNGETIVLGGLMQDTVTDGKSKVPFLADLPLIGGLFHNKKISDSKDELLFFITPKIVTTIQKDQEKNY